MESVREVEVEKQPREGRGRVGRVVAEVSHDRLMGVGCRWWSARRVDDDVQRAQVSSLASPEEKLQVHCSGMKGVLEQRRGRREGENRGQDGMV